MDLEKIFRESVSDIKSEFGLPTSGFLSGGSIANKIWEKVSGNKSVVNDVDIYHLDRVIDQVEAEDFKKKQSFKKKDKVVYEDYSGININYKCTGFYLIENVSMDGIFNNINYISNSNDPQIIIESFDINCCQVGYDIKTDKFYWTKAFEEFLKNGELRLINLSSPAHSAIRLVKKKKDLNAILPEIELNIISYALKNNRFTDTVKYRFKDRYSNMFLDNISELDSRFKLIRDTDLEGHLLNTKGITDRFWSIEPKSEGLDIDPSQKVGFYLSKDFIFWARNIFGSHDLEKTWFNLNLVFDTSLGIEGYLDITPSKDEMELIKNLTVYASDCVNNLMGLSLSKQLYIINKLFDKFSNDRIIAISILETYKIENIDIEDDMNLLLLELSVRKKILDDPKDKVSKIFDDATPCPVTYQIVDPF